MKYDVFFYEAFEEERSAIQSLLPPDIRAGFSVETLQRTGHTTPPAPLISIRTQSDIPAHWHPPVLGVLARSTGYDHLLPLRARPNAPQLACLPEYCTRAVAEQAALLWMALLRKLPTQLHSWHQFQRDALTGGENAGRTLLVAGVGRIGHEVVRIGRGLDMRVRGADLVPRHTNVDYIPLNEGVATADIIAVCMNLTAENRGLFNYALLKHARPGCLFVNVARGELAVTEDLSRLLEEGVLGGVGLDVFNDETVTADALRTGQPHPEADRLRALATRSNVLFTPHNAFNTAEAVLRKSEFSIRQVSHFLKTGAFEWPLSG